MDSLTRAANLEDCANRWRNDAQRYTGRRKEWRLRRGDYLMGLAYAIIGLYP